MLEVTIPRLSVCYISLHNFLTVRMPLWHCLSVHGMLVQKQCIYRTFLLIDYHIPVTDDSLYWL